MNVPIKDIYCIDINDFLASIKKLNKDTNVIQASEILSLIQEKLKPIQPLIEDLKNNKINLEL